jgi:hypothetical protein
MVLCTLEQYGAHYSVSLITGAIAGGNGYIRPNVTFILLNRYIPGCQSILLAAFLWKSRFFRLVVTLNFT